MYKYIILLLVFCSQTLLADFSYEVKQATYLEAEEATVFPSNSDDSLVLIQVVGLKPGSKIGATITFEGLTEERIEVSQLIKFQGVDLSVFPPQEIKPTNGQYIILGKPGERYGVSARTETGIKRFVVELGPTSAPDPEDPTDPEEPSDLTPADLESVKSLVKQSTTSLADPISERYIKEALSSLSLSEVLSEAKMELKAAIGDALVESMKEVRPSYKDWIGLFRQPLDAKLVELESQGKIKTGKDLQKVVQAVVNGMSSTSSVLNSNGTIKMYTRRNCTICDNWEREVFSELSKVGWKLERIYETSNDFVPRFVICDNNKCSEVIVGYMDLEKFRFYRKQLNGTSD